MSRLLIGVMAASLMALAGCSGDADTKHQPGQSFLRTGGDVGNGARR